jgi:hypothetical protein
MPTKPSPTIAPVEEGKKYFTVAQANQALPYVRRVTSDIREAYRRAVSLQQEMEFPLPDHDTDQLRDEYERIMQRLNELVDELTAVGAELKDYDKGLVDFPAVHEGREVLLCWMLGEDEVKAWHEVDAGFAGRREIETLRADLPEDDA